jgi:hypothetical protein
MEAAMRIPIRKILTVFAQKKIRKNNTGISWIRVRKNAIPIQRKSFVTATLLFGYKWGEK